MDGCVAPVSGKAIYFCSTTVLKCRLEYFEKSDGLKGRCGKTLFLVQNLLPCLNTNPISTALFMGT